MSGCCSPAGYGQFFNEREARRNLRRYRAKGLDRMAQRMADDLSARNLAGRTVLEIGGGIGALHVELLKAGADRAVNVEISPGYEPIAQKLLQEEGLADRVERTVMDFADRPLEFEPADDVVMNRVVCCYPDMEKLMTAALGRTRRLLAATFPRDRWYVRLALRVANRILRMRRIDFQAYVHAPRDIMATAERQGFDVVFNDHNFVWRAMVFERAA